LVSGAIADVQILVKDQIELTKVQISRSAKEAGSSIGLLIGAGVLGFVGFIFLLVTAAYVLNLWLPLWASFLIVSVVVLIVAAILALLGKKRIDKAKMNTQRAVTSAQETRALLTSKVEELEGAVGIDAVRETTAG
jgi:membrane protein implicated in regulation of membrane protease activity